MGWFGKESTIFGRQSKLGGMGTAQYPDAPLGAIPNWGPRNEYIKDQEVMNPATGLYYRATVTHYATDVFSNDLLNGLWVDFISGIGVTPTLQQVTDEGNTTTTQIIVGSLSDGSFIQDQGIGGTNAGNPTWAVDNQNGVGVFSALQTNTISNLNGIIKPYKSYTIRVTQLAFGVLTPNITVFENNLSNVPSWNRTGPGVFLIISTGDFTAKTWFSIHMPAALENDEYFCDLERIDNNTCRLSITNVLGGAVDGFQASIEIRVYN